jgi:hypothetical protein
VTTSINAPYVAEALDSVMVPITTDWSRGPTSRLARMSPNQAEQLAHRLIIAAAKVRAERQMTARE